MLLHRDGIFVLISSLLLWVASIDCVELTFELVDNAKDCFYEDIKKNESVTFEYQVGSVRT